jgi:hypothetical protein
VAAAMGVDCSRSTATTRSAGLGPGIRRRWPTLDVLCDPEMPPIPPHAICEQIRALSSALARDDPEAWHLMYQGAKTKAQAFLPHRR